MNEVAKPKDQKPRRILLKISGEALMGDGQFGIDQETCLGFARDVKAARDSGIELCLVIGGGNIFRGISGAAKGMERATADYMGMLATIMNALALQGALESIGVRCRRCVSLTSVAGQCGTWKRDGSSFLLLASVVPFSRPILVLPCAPLKWAVMPY